VGQAIAVCGLPSREQGRRLNAIVCPTLRVVTAFLAALAAAPAQDMLDPAFAKVPFDRWLTDRDQSRFQWSARVTGGELSGFQRLRARIEITVDGNELVKRRGPGELAYFIQFTDGDHRRYQSHGSMKLEEVTEEAGKSNFVFAQNALATPGDYRVDVALLDTDSGEHATVARTLHLGPLKNDPLPDAWRGLPAVEFTEAGDPPDVWFQPRLTGRLHLPLETRKETRIEVLVNASPSALGPKYRTGQVNNRSIAEILPSLKVISEVELKPGTLGVSVFDLTRREVLFTQDRVDPRNQPLDWPRLRPALQEADPNKIDVHELAERVQNAQFFVEEVRRRVVGAAPRALIILSGPLEFPRGADLHPIELAEKPEGRVFYIRYHPAPMNVAIASSRAYLGRRRGLGQSEPGFAVQEPLDALEPLLKPLQPRVFEVYDAAQFRKVLAELMKEIARM
jgi:hypothetical protein